MLGEFVGERPYRLLSAVPRLALAGAGLRPHRRVDPEQSDRAAADLDRVAIDDVRLTGDVVGRGGGDPGTDRYRYGADRKSSGHRCTSLNDAECRLDGEICAKWCP